jgi:hypothetical protein
MAAGERAIDQLIQSPVNLNQCPMMRRMFAKVETEYIWWFDDDSCSPSQAHSGGGWLPPNVPRNTSSCGGLWPGAITRWASRRTGERHRVCAERGLVSRFAAASWKPGGKGEFNFNSRGRATGRGFVPGGCWLLHFGHSGLVGGCRLIKMGNDVLLGEAIRQQGWGCFITQPGSPSTPTAPGQPG